MLICSNINFSEFFNLKFFSTLFSLFASLDVFLFKMFLVEVASQFFPFVNLEYVGSIFLSA